jgi:hypothetical protein
LSENEVVFSEIIETEIASIKKDNKLMIEIVTSINRNKTTYLLLQCFFLLFFSCSQEEEVDSVLVPKPVIQLIDIQSTMIELDWEDLEGVVVYEIDVSLNKDFNELLPEYNAVRVMESVFIVRNLTPTTNYFIRVRAVYPNSIVSGNSNIIEAVTTESIACNDPAKYVFFEKGGAVKVEFENAEFGAGWVLKTGNEKTSGRGYMVWDLTDYFSGPSTDLVTYNIKISNPGTYRFIWNSAVTKGADGTEHNDSWLRFPDANDFYADKNGVRIYPKGTGKTPNPEGASKDGWFKVYRSGNDVDFKWQSRTSDNDPHLIYVQFDEAKIYTMQVSARSNGHGIDKFALFLESLNESEVINSEEFSEIDCL